MSVHKLTRKIAELVDDCLFSMLSMKSEREASRFNDLWVYSVESVVTNINTIGIYSYKYKGTISPKDITDAFYLVESYRDKIKPFPHSFSKNEIGITDNTSSFFANGGFTAVFEEELKEQTFKDQVGIVNRSVITTNTTVRISAIVTCVFSAVIVTMAILTYFKGDPKGLEDINRKLRTQDSLLMQIMQSEHAHLPPPSLRRDSAQKK